MAHSFICAEVEKSSSVERLGVDVDSVSRARSSGTTEDALARQNK